MNPRETVKIGETYGRLTVVEQRPTRHRSRYFLCRCSCGTETEVQARHLRSGNTKSCGCLRVEIAAANSRRSARRQGLSKHPLYSCWRAMLARCENPAHPSYHRYGGRGITVCQQWREDPVAFFDHMGERPPGTASSASTTTAATSPATCGGRRDSSSSATSNHRRSRLPIDEIRAQHAAGIPQHALAATYGVHQSTISRALHGRASRR